MNYPVEMRPGAVRVVGATRAAPIAQQPYTEILRALHAQYGHHDLDGKRFGQRYLIKLSDLISWLQRSPRPSDQEQAKRLMTEPKLTTRVFDLKAAASAYSVSVSVLRREIAAGRLMAKRVNANSNSRYLVSEREMDAWFESLPDA